ncbi:ParD-like antitoxin of type II toxin-antitoxin system [Marisediminitalea aggregata]|uniref:ParD-like antitoxin of type II toxin-antitoxin system n=2 Tax=Alteromonadaceae TaxID=72275 RepID=A0A1M5Q9X0_9ALTE|nr:ParD-like antitoxin of type II toxin-antitoxin system [Marisediminitalea aggregata]
MLHYVAKYILNALVMGIVKISDALHEEVRKTSTVMERSINSQAEFWMKVGRIAEQNPTLTYEQIIEREMRSQNVESVRLVNE